MQKIIIVDEEDTPISLKFRNEIDYSVDNYRWSSIWITNSKGEVLMAQRKLSRDKDPGIWGPAVSGTVEEGETYESNAYKEAEEELGLTGINLDLGPKERMTVPRKSFGQWFVCKVDKSANEFTPQEDEVEQIAWIAKEELLIDVKNNPNKYTPIVKKAIDSLILF
jgi:isopentenyldiphosphate isomerase